MIHSRIRKRFFSLFILTLLLALTMAEPIYASEHIDPSENDTVNGKNYVEYIDAEELASAYTVDFSDVGVPSTLNGRFADTEGYIKVYSGGTLEAKHLQYFITNIKSGKIIPDLIIPVYESEEKTEMIGYLPLVFDKENEIFVSPHKKYNDFSAGTLLLLSTLSEESEIDGVRINADKAFIVRFFYSDNFSAKILYNEIDGKEYYIDLNGSAVKYTSDEIKSYTPEEYIAKRTEVEDQLSHSSVKMTIPKIIKTALIKKAGLLLAQIITLCIVVALIILLLLKRKNT